MSEIEEQIENTIDAIHRIARAIKDGNGIAPDPHGKYVGSVSEGLLSMAFSLQNIANAIDRVADIMERE